MNKNIQTYLDDVQIRLLILFTLKYFNVSMTIENMQDVLVYDNIIDYFTMMDFVFDMQNLSLISTYELKGQTRYDITMEGEEMLKMFADKIPNHIKNKVIASMNNILSNLNAPRQIMCGVVSIDISKYCAKCGIYERGFPLFELNLLAGSHKEATRIAARFKTMAAEMYTKLIEELAQDEE